MRVGHLHIPHGAELEHVLIPATIGSGKTQALHQLLDRVFWGCDGEDPERPEKAILADSDGAFLSTRGRGGKDNILNPFDIRTVKWGPYSEILNPEFDFNFFASAMIPTDGFTGQEKDFRTYARDLLRDVMRAKFLKGETNPRETFSLLTSNDFETLAEIVQGGPSASLFAKGNDRFLGSVVGVLSSALAAWAFLPSDGTFSVRKWIREGRGALFLTYNEAQIDSLRPLITCWLSLAIRETLSLPWMLDKKGVSKRRIWLIADELDRLGTIQGLTGALANGRKPGLSVIATIQSLSQLRDKNGRDGAQTILSCFVNKLIMRQGDFEDAKHWSDYLGQVEETKTSHSHSASAGMRTGVTVGENSGQSINHLVLPSELQMIPKFSGYGRLSGEPAIIPFQFKPQKWPLKHQPFKGGA